MTAAISCRRLMSARQQRGEEIPRPKDFRQRHTHLHQTEFADIAKLTYFVVFPLLLISYIFRTVLLTTTLLYVHIAQPSLRQRLIAASIPISSLL